MGKYDPSPRRRRKRTTRRRRSPRRRYRRRTYDPARKRRKRSSFRKVKTKLSKFWDSLQPYFTPSFGLLGFFGPKLSQINDWYIEHTGSSNWGSAIKDYFTQDIILDFTRPRIDKTISKLTNPQDRYFKYYAGPFWGGLALTIATKLPIPFLKGKLKTFLGKIGTGLFVGSLVGSIFCWQGSPSRTPEGKISTSNNTTTTATELSYYG